MDTVIECVEVGLIVNFRGLYIFVIGIMKLSLSSYTINLAGIGYLFCRYYALTVLNENIAVILGISVASEISNLKKVF